MNTYDIEKMHAIEKQKNIAILLEASGAAITDCRDARTTLSDYALLQCGDRRVDLRGSDHGNFGNPRTAETARKAMMLKWTAPGFERALALWLGWSEKQIKGLNLHTQRDARRLVALPRG